MIQKFSNNLKLKRFLWNSIKVSKLPWKTKIVVVLLEVLLSSEYNNFVYNKIIFCNIFEMSESILFYENVVWLIR